MDTNDTSKAATPLEQHSQAIASIVERVGASAFAVLGRRGAIASAVVWRPGLVVTAAHVFRRTPAAVSLVGAEGQSLSATLVGIDSPTDLALFRLAGEDAAPVAGAGDAAKVKAGHLAIAVGRSGDGDLLASAGLVNRAGGPWQTWLGGQVDRLVRLDGGIYDGLSGAAVADASGAVIGIATAALSRSYGIVVPASTVSRVVDALVARGHVARPWIGIGAQSVPLPSSAGRHGLLVTSLAAGGPAARAGILVGDIVAGIGGAARGEGVGDATRGEGVGDAGKGEGVGDAGKGEGVGDAGKGEGVGDAGKGEGVGGAASDKGVGVSKGEGHAAQAIGDLSELRRVLGEHVGNTVALQVVRGGAPIEVSLEVGERPERRCC